MKKKTKLTLFIGIPVIVLAAAITLFLALGGAGSPSDKPDGSKTITIAQYNKIEKGMSYAEVKALIGLDGALQSEAGEKGTDTYVATYVWKGKTANAVAVIMFQGDKMASKTQVGIT